MKWGLKVFLKYLTPSVTLRDSRSSSPLYISASPTSRFFSAGPRFVSSSTVRSNQSSINSSYLNQDVDPAKSSGLFVVIPLRAEESNVDSARYAPTNDFLHSFLYSDGRSPKIPSQSLIGTQTKPTHAGPCSRQDPLLLPRNNRAPLPLCGCWYVLFV